METLERAVELHRAGDLARAKALYEQLLARDPNQLDALHMLGLLLHQLGQRERGLAMIQRAVALNPSVALFHNSLGNILADLRQLDKAAASFRAAIALSPSFAEPHNNLANVFRDQGRFDEAMTEYRAAIALDHKSPAAHANLARVLFDLGKLEESASQFRTAIQLDPQFAQAWTSLGSTLRAQGLIDDAVHAFRTAKTLRPDLPYLHSNYLFALHFHPDFDGRRILEEHRNWAREFATLATSPSTSNRNARLRIGLVSPDFRHHPVGRFLLPLVAFHDRARVEIVCYADVSQPDSLTQLIRAQVAQWHDTAVLDDAQLADKIRANSIDVLIDLSLHTAGNRMMTFARKPAPIQLTYLAYPGTSGLPTMDYRITDPFLDPPGNEPLYTERSISIPTYWCYVPPGDAHPVTPLTAVANGLVTFGCLNNFTKVSDACLDTWRDVITSIPNSRLLLFSHPGSHLDRVRARIPAERVEFIDRQSIDTYFQTYNRIDIALDPFPYNGGTTTCDALFMGCPVVTLAGQIAVHRAGASLLNQVNLPQLVANSPSEYAQIAQSLSSDLSSLSALRQSLRPRMLQSRLCNGPQFARDFTDALLRLQPNPSRA